MRNDALYAPLFTTCPKHWAVVPLPDAIDFREGPGILAKDFHPEGVPLLRLASIERPFADLTGCNFLDPQLVAKRWDHFRVAVDDLLISTSGTLGRVSIATEAVEGAIPYTGIIRMRPAHPGVDSGYIRYFLSSSLFAQQATASAAGSVLKHFGPSHLREMAIPIPPLAEQRAMAGILGSLDDKIEQNRRTGAKLEDLARAVFKAWFVDFEPVKAKAAGATAFPGMPPETFATLPTRFTNSNLGPVPDGWELKPIGDLVTVRGGGTPSTKDDAFWTDGKNCWATPKDLSSLQHPVLLSTERRITDAGAAKISSGVLPIDTVLLSSRAPVGYLALAKVPTAVNQGFIAIECNGPLKPHFMLHWLDARMEEIKGRASGTTFAEISKSAFRPIPAIVPLPAIVSAFEEVAKPMFDMITHSVAESSKLAALRDYLLPRLLCGRVRVGEPFTEVKIG